MTTTLKTIHLALILLISLNSFKALGQSSKTQFNRDSSQTITLLKFNQRVDRAINLLKTKKLSKISDTDHINIMMCYNTIFMTNKNDPGHKLGELKDSTRTIIIYATLLRFSGGRYDELENLINGSKYFNKITKIYPDWQPNRGMGMYFPKLQMEIDGLPNAYAFFKVSE